MALDTLQQNNTSQWSQLSTQGPLPTARSNWQAVSDNSSKVYLYGGCNPYVNCPNVITEMFIFDSLKYSWTSNSQSNPSNFQMYYSATMLPDGKIIYIGGIDYYNAITDINLVK